MTISKNELFEEIPSNKDVTQNSFVRIKYSTGTIKFVAISELYHGHRRIYTLAQLKRAIKGESLQIKLSAATFMKVGVCKPGVDDVFKKTDNLDNLKVFERFLKEPKHAVTEMFKKDGDKIVLREAHELSSETVTLDTNLTSDGRGDKSILVQIAGKGTPELVRCEDVGYFDESSNFSRLTKFSDADGKDIVVKIGGEYKAITKLFTGALYSIGAAMDGKVETYNPETGERIHLVENEVTDSVDVVAGAINHSYYEQRFKSPSRKVGENAMLELKSYTLSKDGRFIKVRIEGDVADTLVPITSIRKADALDEVMNEETIKNAIESSSPLVAVDDEHIPHNIDGLTYEQLAVKYDEKERAYEVYAEDSAPLDIEDTYLLLKTGEYVREKEVVQPRCLNFVEASDPNFDYYVITIGSGDAERSYVLDKATVEHRAAISNPVSMAVGRENIEFRFEDLQKAKKSSSGLSSSDIVLTTSSQGSYGEMCKIIRKPGEHTTELSEEKRNRLREIYEKFLANYKNRQYDLNGEILLRRKDGDTITEEFVEYVKNHRYKISSTIPELDYGVNSDSALRNLIEKDLTMEGDKITGGPEYNYKKAMAESLDKFHDVTTGTFLTAASGPAALLFLAYPAFAVALVPTFIVARIGLAIYHNRQKKKVENWKTADFENKVDAQRAATKDKIFEEIKACFEDLKTKMEAAPDDAERAKLKAVFNAHMSRIEGEIETLSACKTGGEFVVVDGKGKVTQANAHEYSRYMKLKAEKQGEVDAINQQISELRADCESGKLSEAEKTAKLADIRGLEADLTLKQNELDAMKNYTISGEENEEDPEYKIIKTRVARAKGFMLAKFFGEEVHSADASITDTQIKEALKAIDVEVEVKEHDFAYVKDLKSVKDKHEKKSIKKVIKKVLALIKGDKIKFEEHGASSELSKVEESTIIKALEGEVVEEEVLERSAKAELGDEIDKIEGANPSPEPIKKPVRSVKESKPVRPLKGLKLKDAENIIDEVCKAMDELDKITDAYYGDNDLIGGEEERAKPLVKLYEYNVKILTAVVEREKTKLYQKLHPRYSSKILEATEKYKKYMIYVENKSVTL